VGLEHLPPQLRNPSGSFGESLQEQTAHHEAQVILGALEQNRWNRQAAARQLGIHKTTLFKKIKRYGIELPPVGGRSRE
jgi:transcriptional regulator of acetoin/glycerol metabolism